MQTPISNNTILITGINGFVGQYTAKALIEKGYKIIGMDLQPKCNLEHPSVKYTQADITDPSQVEKVLNNVELYTVVHLAALVHNKGKDLSLNNFMKINYEASCNLIECSLRCGAKTILFASTIEVYGEPKQEVINEETPCIPESYYAQSKLKAEKELKKLAEKYDARYGIMRLAPVYAQDFKLNLNKRIYLPKKIAAYYFRDGDYSYNFCSVHNITDFVIGFLQKEISSGIYVVSDKKNIKAIELIKLEKEMGIAKRIIKMPYDLTKFTIRTIEWISRRISKQEPYFSLYNFRKLFRSTKFSSEKMEKALGGINWDYKNTLYRRK